MTRHIWTSATQVDIHMTAPSEGLVLNGDGTITFTNSETVQGFQAHDWNGNEQDISSVTIVADQYARDVIVRIVFAAAPTENLWIEMGRRKDGAEFTNGTHNGPATGGRHALRTTTSFTCPKTGATLYERAPCAQFYIGRK